VSGGLRFIWILDPEPLCSSQLDIQRDGETGEREKKRERDVGAKRCVQSSGCGSGCLVLKQGRVLLLTRSSLRSTQAELLPFTPPLSSLCDMASFTKPFCSHSS
jgi:hypothetical protein